MDVSMLEIGIRGLGRGMGEGHEKLNLGNIKLRILGTP